MNFCVIDVFWNDRSGVLFAVEKCGQIHGINKILFHIFMSVPVKTLLSNDW